MLPEELFSTALGLTAPWKVTNISFSLESKRLDLTIDFPRGTIFACPVCGSEAKAYDTKNEQWRHLNFFQYEAILHARVPRVDCSSCGVIRKIGVPWARPDSGFTLLFEALIMTLVREMPVNALAGFLGEHDTRLWRVIDHYVTQARTKVDCSSVASVGADETSSRKNSFISLFYDLDEKRLLFATPGKDHETVNRFTKELRAHGGEPAMVTSASIDMSKAFIKGMKENFPNVQITFDHFHVIKLINDAISQVRAEEAHLFPGLLNKTRYLFLRNPEDLQQEQQDRLLELSRYYLKSARAYMLKLNLQDVYLAPDREEGEARLKKWYSWAIRCQIPQVKSVAKTIKAHWDGVLNWFVSKVSNGFLEAINGLIQAAKARARGYRSDKNLINMAYLIAGKLDFQLPT